MNKNKRILLIAPPFYRIINFYNRYFPFGITLLATILKQKGYDVKVYDADCNDRPLYIDYSILPKKYPVYLESFKIKDNAVWLEMRQALLDFKPDIVGISAFTTFAASAFYTAKICKEVFPDSKVIMGGPHATVKADEILKISPDVDFVIRGEGEEALIELLTQIEKSAVSLSNIKGLSYREKTGVIHNPAGKKIDNIDIFPFPDRTLLINEKKYTSEDMGLIMTSRGCPYSCTYCATDTKRAVFRSVDSVIEEIIFIKKRYNTTQFTFKDDSFTVNKKRVIELCDKIIGLNLNIFWECNTRVNLIDEDILKLMKKAGCNFIKIGIESGSEKVLEGMHKGITLSQIKNSAKVLNKIGIHWTGYFLIGTPGETKDDIYKTLDFVREIKPDAALLGVYESFPGTLMFEDGIKRGLIKPNMTLNEYYTIMPNNYYKIKAGRQVDTIDEEEFNYLEEKVKNEFNNYNKRPANIYKMLKAKISVFIKNPAILLEDIKKYYSYLYQK
jgi:radical SAM superfamily enzyme YgiQ (UPF0313 family)